MAVLPVQATSMGPSLFSSEDVTSDESSSSSSPLQWGRAYSARKTSGPTGGMPVGNRTSMGPSLFSSEDCFVACLRLGVGPTSMGPSLFSSEDVISFTRWDFRKSQLQWGRAYSARKTKTERVQRLLRVRFNGAELIQLGRPATHRSPATHGSSFNGAELIQLGRPNP